MTALRIAVVSDIHAFDGPVPDPAPSYMKVSHPESDIASHPIMGLADLINREALVADVLVSAGDMCDKANESGVQYAWRKLHDLRQLLQATRLLATPGNHDLDSRSIHPADDPDPKGMLQQLVPPFPLAEETLNMHFWARNFVLVEENSYRVLILNSCAYHGGDPKEIEHGRVSKRTLTAIRSALERSTPRPVNLLLCHHHPQSHHDHGLGEADVMKQGQLLLDLLGTGEFGEWMVIHGHKHHPKLSYAQGGASSPVVFAAGSLAANVWAGSVGHARNQFYIVEIDASGPALRGFVRAWDWTPGLGWMTASSTSGLPAISGFGARENLNLLASQIASYLQAKGDLATATWADVAHHVTSLRYVIPSDLRSLKKILAGKNVALEFSDSGVPTELGLMPGERE